ncbi:MAG TPA: DUF5683 domain-containing protein [Acidobacteriota bacterium]|nr:DUF5683 domain-containing protein [Acidobacteriota bacterium]
MKRAAYVLLLAGLLGPPLHADTTDVTAPALSDTVIFQPVRDTSRAVQVANPSDFEKHLTQNPTAALFKSMLVPGLGQIGNRRWVKAAVIIGLETWFIGSAVHYGRQAADFRDQWENATGLQTRRILYDLYEDRRDERNKFTWFAGVTIFVSMFDAYVDAHLSGSPGDRRNDQVDWDVAPDGRGGVRALVTYPF